MTDNSIVLCTIRSVPVAGAGASSSGGAGRGLDPGRSS